MPTRERVLAVIAIFAAAIFIRFGFWQLDRLQQRRARNEVAEAKLAAAPVSLDSLRGASDSYRRVVVTGRFDGGHEVSLANRGRDGSPGIHVLTPLLRAGRDTAVMILRGWEYAPDAMHAQLWRWREDSARGAIGYVLPYGDARGGPGRPRERIIRSLERAAVAKLVPYPIAPYVVVLLEDSSAAHAGSTAHPPRIGAPPLGEGSHMGYAFQWFSFAAIAMAGLVVFLRSGRRDPARDSRFIPNDTA